MKGVQDIPDADKQGRTAEFYSSDGTHFAAWCSVLPGACKGNGWAHFRNEKRPRSCACVEDRTESAAHNGGMDALLCAADDSVCKSVWLAVFRRTGSQYSHIVRCADAAFDHRCNLVRIRHEVAVTDCGFHDRAAFLGEE